MSPGEELKAAAHKIRERAKDADKGPWCEEYAHWAIRHVERNVDKDTLNHDTWHDKGDDCKGFGMYAGRYIAIWHRDVGEAVAELLDHAYPIIASYPDGEYPHLEDPWLKLARAINGNQA